MSGVIGSNAGYATVDPLQNHMGQAMSANDDLAMKYRALNDEAMRRKAAERLAKEKLAQDAEEKDKLELDKTKNEMTPYSTINGPLSEAIMSLKKNYAEASHQYRNNFGLSESEKLKHMDTMNNSLSTLGRLSQNSKLLNDNLKNFKDHAGDYDQDSYDEFMHRLSSLENGQYKLDLSNGNQNVTIANPDGKGEPVTMSFEDFVNGKKVYRKSTLNDDLEKTSKDWQLNETEVERGDVTIKNKQWGKKDDVAADAFANRVLSNEHDLYAASKKYKIPMDNKEGIAAAIKSEIKNKVGTTYEKHIDEAARETRRHNRATEDKDKVQPAIVGQVKFYTKDGKSNFGANVGKNDAVFTIHHKGMKYENGSSKVARQVIVNKKTGDVVYSGEETNPEDWRPRPQLAEKLKANPSYVAVAEDYFPQAPKKVNFSTRGDAAQAAMAEEYILNMRNPESKKGAKFKSVEEGNEYFRRKAGYSDEPKPKAAKPSVDEAKIKFLMKQNKGATRQQIIDALNNQK